MFKKKFLYICVVLLFMIATLVPSSHVFGQEETQEPCEGRRASLELISISPLVNPVKEETVGCQVHQFQVKFGPGL